MTCVRSPHTSTKWALNIFFFLPAQNDSKIWIRNGDWWRVKNKNPISQLLFFLTEKGRVIVGKLTAGVMAVRPICVGVFFVFGWSSAAGPMENKWLSGCESPSCTMRMLQIRFCYRVQKIVGWASRSKNLFCCRRRTILYRCCFSNPWRITPRAWLGCELELRTADCVIHLCL